MIDALNDPLTPEQEEWVMDLAVKYDLGERMGQIGALRGKEPDVFHAKAGYRTHELFCFAAELLAAAPSPEASKPVQAEAPSEQVTGYVIYKDGRPLTIQQAEAPSEQREEIEAVIACLGDDAAQLRQDNPEDERADNMDRAAELLEAMAAVGVRQEQRILELESAAHSPASGVVERDENGNLPCPFCGGECDPAGWLGGDGKRGPECEECGATAESTEVWNTRAALSTQPQQAVAWATMNEEGEPAMLFFDKQEARHYCGEDEEPRALGFIDLPPVPGQEGGE